MKTNLSIRDIERLENTSFASVFTQNANQADEQTTYVCAFTPTLIPIITEFVNGDPPATGDMSNGVCISIEADCSNGVCVSVGTGSCTGTVCVSTGCTNISSGGECESFSVCITNELDLKAGEQATTAASSPALLQAVRLG